ncbi:phosphate ABC transporter substrate-binding protein PstS [Propionicimonas sp.]|uniref:phosphate ABC transporter substrate-binding protein PstS n=1 Tax=Propionicimonas sp. TaxID=1955623 RepID=UPI0017C923E1|nr:phosphate ABC transporter substrate-binding protein PstS [Propionicimonas sp.]MBU3975454.1 phosphate ABC transporter substrate-binding protein PstS [Actinomycetota bacterium]MBA3020140.1 phosphate ABC transporter substrate-binding protein PstS [Propionicimonas sp.]MBU3986397.1 phosphate ABC transporter substrate-binding protein PstS [Actinomycetota bacterium]MBU4007966.1 phosphate ABC transporter substrate-binding protein PstS [Actinomycetota bacterium]MBU4064224.1 phosphate ABC transporter
MRPKTIIRAALMASLTLLLAAPLASTAARAETPYPITGTGSTWSKNALEQWRTNVFRNYQMTINYTGLGSTSGRRDFIDGTVDFAISEIPFQAKPEDGSAPEKPSRGYAYMPIVAGGTSFMYHLKINGKRVTNLRLSGDTITKIFTGAISNWNDPAIKTDNPALAMPDKRIVPVIRSDGSGTSAQFTLWMSKQYPSLWKKGMTSQFRSFGNSKSQAGSDGVAGYVSQNYGEGAITYVEYSYAKKAGFPVAKVLNKSGYYVEPTASSVAVAMMKAEINDNKSSADYLTQILDGVYNSADKRAYPLSSYSYMIVPTEVAGIFNTNKGNTLGAFARYVLCEGQQQADTLGYSPLPMNLVMAGSEQIKKIPGAGNEGVDTAKCNNPTFKAGDSPSKNQLALTAPYPAACDKKGTSQCSTGTGGATQDTPVTGGGTGGNANNNSGGATGTGTTTGTGGTTGSDTGTGTGTGTVTDENGNVLSANGTSAGGAVASAFTLPDPGMGTSQWLMVAAALLLVASVVVPPLVSQRLKAGEGHGD